MFKKSIYSKITRTLICVFVLVCALGAVCSFAADDAIPVTNTNIITEIFNVFDQVGDWLIAALGKFTTVFYSDTSGLTFLGILALVALGISVIFLVIGIIQRFLHFGG